MPDSTVVECLRRKFDLLQPLMNERMRRNWAAAEAMEIGWGGVSAVVSATGLSHNTVDLGIRELEGGASPGPMEIPPGRVRRVGGGRRPVTQDDASLLPDLESLVDPVTRGDPQSPLRWTCKSVRVLAQQLQVLGHSISYPTVRILLLRAGYSLQSNRKVNRLLKNPSDRRIPKFFHGNLQDTGCPIVRG